MNIIFDLGGVVLHWKPDELIRRNFKDPGDQKRVRENFLGHPDWIELDRGTLDIEEALYSAADRTSVSYTALKRMMDDVPLFLLPQEEIVDLIRRVKERGHKLYVLSNMHHASMDYLLDSHEFFRLFDGIVASCRVGMVKPEPEIFQHILDRFSLEPSRTVFIDDMKENVDAAARQGIQVIHFKSRSQCEKALKELNCL